MAIVFAYILNDTYIKKSAFVLYKLLILIKILLTLFYIME